MPFLPHLFQITLILSQHFGLFLAQVTSVTFTQKDGQATHTGPGGDLGPFGQGNSRVTGTQIRA